MCGNLVAHLHQKKRLIYTTFFASPIEASLTDYIF